MIKLTPTQIKDFQICERLYDFRHTQKLPETIPGRSVISQRFENTLKSVVHFFFYKKQGGITPSYSSLLNRWEKLWFPKNTTAYDIIHEQHESLYGNTASLTSKAAAALLDLVEKFSESDIIPIGIDSEYIFPMGNDVYVEDKFDLIYSSGNKTFVIKWAFNHNLKNEFMHVAEMASMYRAFSFKYGEKIKDAKFGYYDLITAKPGFIEYSVSQEDLDALSYWCSSIASENVFPSRRGLTTYCKTCPFDKPCAKWDKWAKKEKKAK
jgi:hypothetical protein